MSARECGSEQPQPFQTKESDICRTQKVVHNPGGELGMAAAYPLLIPFQHRLHLGLFQKLSIRLMQRRPTLPSCPHVQVKKLAEVMAQTGEEAEVLRLQRIHCGLEYGRAWRDTSEKCLFKLLQ